MKLFLSLVLSIFFTLYSFSQKSFIDSIRLYKQARIDSIQSLLNFKNDDIIADIGSGNGSNLLRLTAKAKNISLFAEDIDSSKCNKRGFQKILRQLNSSVHVDSIRFFYGNDSTTTLPKQHFTKVLLIAVLHEFTKQQQMLNNVKSLLKPGGEILIEEPLVHKPIPKDKGCNNPYLTEIEIQTIFRQNGFIILAEKLIKDLDKQHNRYRKAYLCKLKSYS